jgi:hypothetical protein
MYDIRRAEGYVWLSGTPSGSGSGRRSPLAFPFLSFSEYLPDFPESDERKCTHDLKRFVVFRHEQTNYEIASADGRTVDLDLIAAVPCGEDIRREAPPTTDAGWDSGTGWWRTHRIRSAELLLVR